MVELTEYIEQTSDYDVSSGAIEHCDVHTDETL